ncbi:MAG TPA: DUF2911 domain-containing protein [Vicinamibacterales bacterium]|jgi:hypothetical protein|nr:DUF2911 domain-containing protein [Vicinamibacterales bacterium]
MTQKLRIVIGASALAAAAGILVIAQENRPLSPSGTAAAQVQGKYVKPAGRGAPALGGESYQGGKWIEITYGRPLKRGRDLWGSGAEYGKAALVGAPIWRAGANVSTRLETEVPLIINEKTVPVGEYSLFIDLKPNNWTFVVSTWPAQTRFDPNNKEALWGSYNYTPDRDVVRAPMTLTTLPVSIEQLTWEFTDMSDAGGKMTIMWDKTMASVSFRVGN